MNKKISWQDPLILAKKIAANYHDEAWILLYSGLNDKVKNSTSYLALFPREKIICDDFFAAEKKLKNSEKKWFGYFSYEVAHAFEKLPKTKNSFINLPKIQLINFALIFEFDHDKKILTAIFEEKENLDEVLKYKALSPFENKNKIKNLFSNFTDKSYVAAISDVKKMIARGDFYQTNLTRKFFGKFSQKQNQKSAFKLFANLVKLSPANYSSFLKLDKNFIISSSPELFLEVKNSVILSRPIKGTAPRDSSAKQDQKNKLFLKNSAKERAENLMIVDLVRNDLARICEPGSVEVKKLFNITSYKNIHHMSSEIHGKISKEFSTIDAIRTCFPPGSMTGAPKIKAMEIAAKKEKINRGIYSGAIGFFDGKKSANFSVVIRTLILQEEKFEFQTGGAITFDSNEKAELAEIFNKAKALMTLLGIESTFQQKYRSSLSPHHQYH